MKTLATLLSTDINRMKNTFNFVLFNTNKSFIFNCYWQNWIIEVNFIMNQSINGN